MKVKICGHTRVEDIAFSAIAGAHAVGVVFGFPSSPRNTSEELARRLRSSVPPFTECVLVTNEDGIKRANSLGFKTVQLVAKPERLSLIREQNPELLIIPVFYVGKELDQSVLRFYLEFELVLLDTKSEKPGGAGVPHDWSVSKLVSKELGRVVLAGGLTPQNVEEAIRVVEPYAVDVSSGVECSPGVKDHKKVSEFIRRAMSVG
jgi:phosphoribosylanthranilate isomerase